MKSPVSAYGFLNAKLRARISKMIPDDVMRNMLEAGSLEEAIHLLSPSVYSGAVTVYEQTGDLLSAELEIWGIEERVLDDTVRLARQFSRTPVADFTMAVVRRFEVRNLKNAVRLWYERSIRGRSVEDKLPYLIRSSGVRGLALEALVNAESPERLIEVTASTPYGPIIQRELNSVLDDRSLFSFEIALDRWYYASLLTAAGKLGTTDRKQAERLIGIEIDSINVNWIVRRAAFYTGRGAGPDTVTLLPGGFIAGAQVLDEALASKQPSREFARLFGDRMGILPEPQVHPDDDQNRSSTRAMMFLEQVLQQQLLYECRRLLGGYPFSIGIVLAYFALVQQEARRIMTILNGRYYGMKPDQIEALL